MKDKNTDTIVEINNGLHTDNEPLEQPKGTYRFALNAVESTTDGNNRKLSNELSNIATADFTSGFSPIGKEYIGDNTNAVILVNPNTNKEEIGLIDKAGRYIKYVDTAVLGLKITNQCDIIFRIRRGNERIIYWVDGLNKPRTFNFDRPHNFYNNSYTTYIQNGGNPNTFISEKWDESSFNLIKTYNSIPFFTNIAILETGSILSGSYNFAIQYVDEDLNPTVWITTSNTVNIYNDSANNSYNRIRGSRNIDNSAQSFPRTNKSVKLTLTNLDINFPYYRVAIIKASSNTGLPDKVYASQLYSTSNSNFTYNGNDSALKEISLSDILIESETIFAPRHIDQIENRLVIAYTEGKKLNLCEFQKYASKIRTDLITKEVILNNIQSDPNVKAAKSTFMYGGYTPGEVESFGIVYIFPDYTTPAYHIPGKNTVDSSSRMKYHEIDDRYLDIHNCSTDNYWSLDGSGQTLLGKKIRHHRFPFRHEVSKPLITKDASVSSITKYRLKLVFSLNPAFTPSPSYPTDNNNLSLVINYIIKYKVQGASGTTSFSSQLVDTDVTNATEIIIYDDSQPLTTVIGSDLYQIDSTSALASYMTGTNNRFVITPIYENYSLSSTITTDKSEIFGIKFDNIEKPHPDCIGFYIVRNEKTDDDKIIVDNAIFGNMTENNQYKSFGLIMPKQYYTASNCGTVNAPNKTVQYFNKGIWFFNPEFQYFQKKTEFDRIEVEGTYTEDTVNMPTISNVDNSTCNSGRSRGLYINDVQAGTSFNPEINKNKDKDDDGFDLLVGYRNVNVNFTPNNSNIQIPAKDRVMYLNAASYQNYNSNTYYNVSVDNKIGMYITDTDIDTTVFRDTVNNKSNLLYGSLVKNNTSSYSDFLTRTYYKEHNNPVLFGTNNVINGFEVYNGDANISAMHLVSSVYYDMIVANRAKKSNIWKIVVGAVLIAGAAIATVATLGAAAPTIGLAIVAASSLAISYGVSLIVSGIKFEQFKSMIDVDYEKGLKDTVSDGGTYETIRENLETEDDTIRWFSDRVSNVYIESEVPFGLRSGLTSGVSDFIDAPASYDENEFRSYLTEKLTSLDRDQGSGRLYKGYASAEVYDMNLDYLRNNREKTFIHLPLEYDCCSDNNEIYPLRRWFSEQSFQEEKTDNYAVFLPNNYNDMEGKYGEITDIFRLGNVLFMHTLEGLWQQPANLQERVTDEVVSFIGTGNFLEIPPRPVLDDAIGRGGTQHKWATLKTTFGVFFISELEGILYLHGAKPEDICQGNSAYFRNNINSFISSQLYNRLGVRFKNDNNPANPNGIGYISAFDNRFKRLIFTKRDYLILEDKLNILVLVNSIPTTGTSFSYCTLDGNFYNGTVILNLNNPLYFEDKGFTMSFSFNSKKWVSWHSYIPNYYISSKDNFYSYIPAYNKLWKHNVEGSYFNFYGIKQSFIFEYISTKIIENVILEDIVLQTIARKWDDSLKHYIDQKYITFNKIIAYNNTQCTGELIMTVKDTQSNPGQWYQQQIVNNANILITNKKGDWHINNFRNYIDNYQVPMFTSKWEDIKNNYFIDKIVNSVAINHSKKWYELESFTDKFITIRLKFDTFDNVNLIVNYTIQSELPSFR